MSIIEQPDTLRPVIYAAFSLPETLDELPLILSGSLPDPYSLHTQVASNSFDRHPLAVIIGGGYDDDAYSRLRSACSDACGSTAKLGVVFLRADNALTDSLVAEGKGPKKHTAGYPQAITARLKGKMEELGITGGALGDRYVGELIYY